MRLIILAAGSGTRLGTLTASRPKCLVELGDRPMIDWQLVGARAAGIDRVVVIGGYEADQLQGRGDRLLRNPDYATTNMVETLFCAESEFGDGFVMAYGDIVYDPAVLRALLASGHDAGVVVDRQWRSYWEARFDDPLSDAESLRLAADGRIASIGQPERDIDRIEAQYIGLAVFRGAGLDGLRDAYGLARRQSGQGRHPFGGSRPLAGLYMTDLLQGMINEGVPVMPVPTDGGWLEIDTPRDLAVAERLLAAGRLGELGEGRT
jgi:choline kinase